MAISIRMTQEEQNLVASYARFHAISVSEAVRRAIFERIEDEYDIAVADEAYREYVADGKRSRPISELWEELGI